MNARTQLRLLFIGTILALGSSVILFFINAVADLDAVPYITHLLFIALLIGAILLIIVGFETIISSDLFGNEPEARKKE